MGRCHRPPGALCSQFALHPQNAGNLVHSLTQNWYFPQVMSHQMTTRRRNFAPRGLRTSVLIGWKRHRSIRNACFSGSVHLGHNFWSKEFEAVERPLAM